MVGCDPSRASERPRSIEFCDAIVDVLRERNPTGKVVSQPWCLEQTFLDTCR